MKQKCRETAENKADQIDLALHAGGDFGLVFTIMPDKIDLARQACDFSIIGTAVEEGIWMESKGFKRSLEPVGYEHMHNDSDKIIY